MLSNASARAMMLGAEGTWIPFRNRSFAARTGPPYRRPLNVMLYYQSGDQ
jgi:hypothetical protein